MVRKNKGRKRLIDNKNKAIVKEAQEAKQIIQQLNIYIAKLEPKKEYNFAVYR
ncbi:MAG: hypothetical protein V1672_04585 [Candidatus Diapherotrites archaeon]